MAIFLAAVAVAVVVALAVLVARRGASGSGASGTGGGRLARRVQGAQAADARYVDDYVDEQAAIWEASSAASPPGRPALFREDVGQVDPRTPEAYDVSDLYVAADPIEDEYTGDDSSEEQLEALVEEVDDGWVDVDEDEELAADQAFAADLDEVDGEPEFDRFAPRRSMNEVASDDPADEFASELLGTGGESEQPTGALVGQSGEALERRTPKTGADAYKQPLRLARTQHRPTGGTRRSPDQIRSMLLNYRGGMKKGREAPSEGPDPETS